MRSIHKPKTRSEQRYRRRLRIRRKLSGTAEKPRISVHRSLKHVYAQLVDDTQGRTLVGVSDMCKEINPDASGDRRGKIAVSFAVGKLLAQRAIEQGIKQVVFDRSGYPYHGRVKAVAEGAREGGLEF